VLRAVANVRVNAPMRQAAIKDICGVAPMIRSRPGDRQNKKFAQISELTKEHVGTKILIRARINTSRAAGGNLVFLLLRQQEFTLQAVVCKSDTVPKAFVKFVGSCALESIVDITVSALLRDVCCNNVACAGHSARA
jgi:hypothetical protein